MDELDAPSLWNRVLGALEGRMAKATIDTWLRPIEALDAVRDARGSLLLLKVGNDFARDWVSRWSKHIEEQLAALTNEPWSVQWTVAPPANTAPSATATAPIMAPKRPAPVAARTTRATQSSVPSALATAPLVGTLQATATTTTSARGANATATAPLGAATVETTRSVVPGALTARLRPTYTFENFVVGPSNQLAHAAALACAEPAGRRFNPLFLCGPSGLGKTHLLNAIGHRVLAAKPGALVVYVSAEHFTNEFIHALHSRTMDEFRKRYREQCEALLLDDVQFFAGKEQTLDEFFHTFNSLFQRDLPIVLTSDVLPQNLQGMPERLLSRFASGMVAEVYAPELETRVAVLRKKAELEGIRLDDEGAFALAQAVATNMRELEGQLIKLAFRASSTGRPGIDAAMVREALRIPTRTRVTTVEDIQRAVCEFYRIKLSQITGRERTADVALARQVAMYLAREKLGTSYPQIGAKFGGKDHTTVMASVQKIKKLLEEDAPGSTLRSDLAAVEAKLNTTGP